MMSSVRITPRIFPFVALRGFSIGSFCLYAGGATAGSGASGSRSRSSSPASSRRSTYPVKPTVNLRSDSCAPIGRAAMRPSTRICVRPLSGSVSATTRRSAPSTSTFHDFMCAGRLECRYPAVNEYDARGPSMLLIPIGRDDAEIRRHAWVSYTIIALNVIAFLLTAVAMRPAVMQSMDAEWESAFTFYVRHPYLKPPAELAELLTVDDKEELSDRARAMQMP